LWSILSLTRSAAGHDEVADEEFHEPARGLERFHSAKSELTNSQEDLLAHGEVNLGPKLFLWQYLHMLALLRYLAIYDCLFWLAYITKGPKIIEEIL